MSIHTHEQERFIPTFYTLSLMAGSSCPIYKQIFEELAPQIKDNILKYVGVGIKSELRHTPYYSRSPNKKCKILTRFFGFSSFFGRKELCYETTINKWSHGKAARAGSVIFRKLIWAENFGGKAWARICEAYVRVEKTAASLSNEVAFYQNVDYLIQLSHNTGNVLNKTLFGIQPWLDFKRAEGNPHWVIGQSMNTDLKKVVRKHVKEAYKMYAEDAAAEAPRVYLKVTIE